MPTRITVPHWIIIHIRIAIPTLRTARSRHDGIGVSFALRSRSASQYKPAYRIVLESGLVKVNAYFHLFMLTYKVVVRGVKSLVYQVSHSHHTVLFRSKDERKARHEDSKIYLIIFQNVKDIFRNRGQYTPDLDSIRF